jgi:NADPH:quinone reductase-like Zn-dependent oxidoreductase
MKSFWQEVLQLPYKSNSQDNPLHEQQVRELLDKYGFNYVWQPNGPQQSPDFRVTLPNGRVVDIECKSSKNTYPTYNGGLPKEGVVYIFSSKRYNETTVFFADDVVSEKKRELYSKLVEELNSVLKVYQLEEEWQEDDRGFDFYIRNMYTQTGAGKKDYFKHSKRKQCESNVLNFDW